ncbi:hypothetical protein Pla22_16990 [Rubripirellula amarantea]|uniref:Glycosyltransferase RgtA/B/C/D-like domain-containing protein n=1 Tax=Rubripirellula amarantea TaxID=2527999 RepID=A0A5C5WT10_9BACT|nr:glycosyltransferase family 39 protein [Rubripirellula amarantea]TWT54064.1 hypothetical protein Pla22_16990 [Rubripirellula amarantea]
MSEQSRHTEQRTRNCDWLKLLLIAVCVVQITFLVVSAYRSSPVRDEFGHFYAGLQYWKHRDIETFNVNPPLIRAIGTLPAYLLWNDVPIIDSERRTGVGEQERTSADHVARGRFEFDDGHQLFARYPEEFQRHLFLGRLLVGSFAVMGTLTLFYWGSICFGKPGGLLAATLWAFQPEIIAHGSLITNDVPVAASMLIACFLFAAWCRTPTWARSIAGGFSLGFATLCKFTALLLWPFFLVFAIYVVVGNRHGRSTVILQSLLAVAVSLGTIAVPYRFEGVGKPIGEVCFLTDQPIGTTWEQTPPRYRERWFANLPMPVPQEFVVGMDRQQYDFETGLGGYAAGTLSGTGWWWFYLYAMLVKLPTGTWLAMTASAVCIYMQSNRKLAVIAKIDVALVGVIAFAMLQITAYKSGFAQQHRYIFPFYPFAFFLTASALRIVDWTSWYAKLTWTGAGLTVVACIGATPHWLGFFNLPSGGSRDGYKHLFNDATDWGQDCYLVRQWLEQHPEIRPVNIVSINGFNSQTPESMGLPDHVTISQDAQRWTVMSKHDLVGAKGIQYIHREPTYEIGVSHFVYEN